jgi:3-oxoacyl-[acyl-carrier protein] reductase
MLDGRAALVTGSSRGIGLAVGRELARAGAHVMLNAHRSAREIQEAVKALPGGVDRHGWFQASVENPDEVAAMMAEVDRRWGRLDILVNNAGVTRFVPHHDLDALDLDLFDRIYRVNLRGVFICIRAARPLLERHPPGLVVNISSIAAMTAIGSNVAYCASKAAVINLTRSLARALAPAIRINAVSPGLIDTELTQGWEGYRDEQIAKNPMWRLGTPEDVAAAVLALATSLPYANGMNLVLDGGRCLT